jgi:hypothetical protein
MSLASIVVLASVVRKKGVQHRLPFSLLGFMPMEYQRTVYRTKKLLSIIDVSSVFYRQTRLHANLKSIIAIVSKVSAARLSVRSWSRALKSVLFLNLSWYRREKLVRAFQSFIVTTTVLQRTTRQRRRMLSLMSINATLVKAGRARVALKSFMVFAATYHQQLRRIRYLKSILALVSAVRAHAPYVQRRLTSFIVFRALTTKAGVAIKTRTLLSMLTLTTVWYRTRSRILTLKSIIPLVTVARAHRPYVQKNLKSIIFILTKPMEVSAWAKVVTLLSFITVTTQLQLTSRKSRLKQLASFVVLTSMLKRAARQRRQLTSIVDVTSMLQRTAQQRRQLKSFMNVISILQRAARQRRLPLSFVVSVLLVAAHRPFVRKDLLSVVALVSTHYSKRVYSRQLLSFLAFTSIANLYGYRHYYLIRLASILALVSHIDLRQVCIVACADRGKGTDPALRRLLYGWSIAKCLEQGEP